MPVSETLEQLTLREPRDFFGLLPTRDCQMLERLVLSLTYHAFGDDQVFPFLRLPQRVRYLNHRGSLASPAPVNRIQASTLPPGLCRNQPCSSRLRLPGGAS